MNMLARAIEIAAVEFVNVEDNGGKPYILHCLWVMHRLEDVEEKQAAVLHDLIEDTSWTFERLIEEGFSDRVVRLIDNITKRDDEDYSGLILRASADKGSIRIKKLDITHNSKVIRLRGFTQKDHNRIIKYQLSYKYLETLDPKYMDMLIQHLDFCT